MISPGATAPAGTGEHIEQQSPSGSRTPTAIAVLAMLAGSAICIAVAPLLMPESYSIVKHAISASGGQGIENAWVARIGFLLLGFAVLTLAAIVRGEWGRWGRVSHRVYGGSMIAVAAFAHRPWEEVPFVEFEDLLHSIAAFAVGFSFTIGVLIVGLHRARDARVLHWFDAAAVLAALVIPMVMFNVAGVEGAVQRVLFLVGYLWYGNEALRAATLRVGMKR